MDRIDNSPALRHSGRMAKPALGRGLGALLGESPIAKPPVTGPTSTTVPGAALATDERERVQRVALDRIRPCPFQPRKDFSPEALRELRSEEHTSELQSLRHLVCRLLLEKKKKQANKSHNSYTNLNTQAMYDTAKYL